MYIYNKNGEMITGAITEKENNKNKIWGSWVYQGDLITIEIKTPSKTFNDLKLHVSNIAYGYKEVYKSIKVGGFGQSGPCNINVICPLGNGWEQERNSVGLILNANGTEWCSGSMIMNTCNTSRPFFLTANHCFNPPGLPQQNVGAWRFTFQALSTTCTPSQNSNGIITYNGSTLRANWAATDMCLVELNNTPATNLGITYAGWTRNAAPAQNATGIHHPSGDVMKISRSNNPVTVGSFGTSTNQHWRADWNQGVTEPGSSGSPLFDQNHRIIGQLHGGPSACGAAQLWDFYGRFDLSWTGGGTGATRLSNWLDPSGSNAIITNTTSTLNLALTPIITGDVAFCSGSKTYSLAGVPAGTNTSWVLTHTLVAPNVASIPANSTGNDAVVTGFGNGRVGLYATYSGACNAQPVTISKIVGIGLPDMNLRFPRQNPRLTGVPINYANVKVATQYKIYSQLFPGASESWTVDTDDPSFNYNYNSLTGVITYFFSNFSKYAIFSGNSTNSCGSTSGFIYLKSVASGGGGGGGGGGGIPLRMLKVFPNPASNILSLETITSSPILEIKISDKIGNLKKQTEISGKTNTTTINISNLPNDIYVIQVWDGKQWISKTFIKN
jgi:lysyl endopeptidase